MDVETDKVKVQVFNTIVLQNVVLRLQQLRQIQVVKDARFGQSKKLPVVEGASILINSVGHDAVQHFVAMLTHIQRLLICSSKTIA